MQQVFEVTHFDTILNKHSMEPLGTSLLPIFITILTVHVPLEDLKQIVWEENSLWLKT